MNIAAILAENEVFSVKGGANSRKAFEIFRRFSKEHKIVLFSGASGATTYDCPNLLHKKVLCGGLRKVCKYFYRYEIAFRLRNRFDVIYVFNRPEFMPALKKSNPAAKLALHMGNDHLMEMEAGLGRRVVAACDLIIATSQYIRAGMLKKHPHAGGKIRVFHNGVNAEQFCPNHAAAEKKEGIILYVGRLCAGKGVHHVIAAVGPIFGKFPNARLKIVGSSWFGENVATEYVERLKALAAPAGARIEFAGYVPNDRVAEHYREADIFVAPSVWNEGFCNANLEAMASGLAVVSSNRGAIPEVVGDAGILIDPENPHDLGVKLEYLLANPRVRRNLAEAARARATTCFDWDRISREIERTMMELAGGGRA